MSTGETTHYRGHKSTINNNTKLAQQYARHLEYQQNNKQEQAEKKKLFKQPTPYQKGRNALTGEEIKEELPSYLTKGPLDNNFNNEQAFAPESENSFLLEKEEQESHATNEASFIENKQEQEASSISDEQQRTSTTVDNEDKEETELENKDQNNEGEQEKEEEKEAEIETKETEIKELADEELPSDDSDDKNDDSDTSVLQL